MRLPPRLTAALLSLALWPFRVAEARATLRRLAALDARALADIGLTPADLNDATALPLAADPGFFSPRAWTANAPPALRLGGRPRRALASTAIGEDRLVSRPAAAETFGMALVFAAGGARVDAPRTAAAQARRR